ncbi:MULTISPECIES: helix-turn-helix transcriptional regulator [unclassified Iodidimonas]|uniref:helix-turn-helix domain-containing protein n=1 Tax=unclassified Iodidimonas TaxID=2626145 RepID=UPI002482FA8C|nr:MULTISPECIES: helix-turn-helix transcriptional regulator [unclassified Iodidimonas]
MHRKRFGYSPQKGDRIKGAAITHDLEALIESIGLPNFDEILLQRAISLGQCHVSLGFLYLPGRVIVLSAAGDGPYGELATLAALRYGARLWPEDHSLKSHLKGLVEKQTRLHLTDRDEVGSEAIGLRLFDFLDARTQMSFYRKLEDGTYILRFYAAKAFSKKQHRAMEQEGGMIMAALSRHGELRKKSHRPVLKQNARTMIADSLTRADRHLTAREVDVCKSTLLGKSVEAISLDLGITENSVRTYKKRAFRRLGISSQAQLFALCFNDATER